MHNQQIEKIYNENYPIIYKYLCCITHNPDIAEELTQETFYKMIRNIDHFRENCKLSSWLCEIAKNLWFDELRKRKRKNAKMEFVEVVNENLTRNEDIEENLIHKEEVSIAYNKINMLDNETKRVMFLRLNAQMSFKEIGQVMSRSENWARVTFYRGKKKVKECD